jgi:hypothetical protein
LKVENDQPEEQPMEQPNSRFWLLAIGEQPEQPLKAFLGGEY